MTAKRDFTDRFLKALKPATTGKRYIAYDAQIPGFGIRVTDRCADENKGAFVLVTRFPGSTNPAPRRIGDYPAMSLAKARELAREWREDIRQGVDAKVKEAERRREQERRRADTFAAVFATFADDHLSTLRTGGDVTKAVEKHVFPRWRERQISAIRRADVNELVRALRKDAPIGANRVLAYLKKFFSWAVDQEMIDASPAASVKRPTKENKRDRVLTETEIRGIWQACGELGAFGKAFRFMLATGQRRSEVGEMTWGEIDRKQKTDVLCGAEKMMKAFKGGYANHQWALVPRGLYCRTVPAAPLGKIAAKGKGYSDGNRKMVRHGRCGTSSGGSGLLVSFRLREAPADGDLLGWRAAH